MNATSKLTASAVAERRSLVLSWLSVRLKPGNCWFLSSSWSQWGFVLLEAPLREYDKAASLDVSDLWPVRQNLRRRWPVSSIRLDKITKKLSPNLLDQKVMMSMFRKSSNRGIKAFKSQSYGVLGSQEACSWSPPSELSLHRYRIMRRTLSTSIKNADQGLRGTKTTQTASLLSRLFMTQALSAARLAHLQFMYAFSMSNQVWSFAQIGWGDSPW